MDKQEVAILFLAQLSCGFHLSHKTEEQEDIPERGKQQENPHYINCSGKDIRLSKQPNLPLKAMPSTLTAR